MSAAAKSVLSTMPSESPVKPEVADDTAEADVPEETAICSSFLDASVMRGSGRSESPTPSSSSNEDGIERCSVDPGKIITEEMLAEERRLHSDGVKAEEQRKEEEAKMLEEMTSDSRKQRYERLKYLLSKSTMYTEYLVERIKKQKDEEEKRKERMLKRKDGKESEKTKKVEEKAQIRTSSRAIKRKQNDEEDDKTTSTKRKRQKKTKATDKTETGTEEESQASQDDVKMETDSSQKSEKSAVDDKTEAKEAKPEQNGKDGEENGSEELVQLAATFGVPDEYPEERYINGELAPALQPVLLEGGVLRSYQMEGYSWLKVLYENGVNGILADEMGLGKTVQCVALISHLVYMGIPGPFLVCAPLSTIPNWFSEFARFAPKVPTVLYHGDKDKRAHLAKRIRRKHKIREGVFCQPVVITSYEIAMIDRRYLANNEWKYLIVDEGHRIKNTHCRLIRELRMYRSTHRLLLTGTPLQNNLSELWSLLNFLLPEIFDDLGSFEAWFDVRDMGRNDSDEKIVKQEQGENILNMLHQILTPFMLRRLKSDVDLCIPPKKEVLVYAPLTPEQKEFYSALVNRTIFNLLDEKAKKNEPVELTEKGRPKRRSTKKIDYAMMMESPRDKELNARIEGGKKRRGWDKLECEERELEDWVNAVCEMGASRNTSSAKEVRSSQVTIKMRNVMMQLRKCCNHPYLLEHPVDPKTGDLALTEGVVKTSGKMLVLDQMLKELKKNGHRVLIFSQMTRMLDLIEDFCHLRSYDYCRLDGSTHVDDRRDNMNTFNKDQDKFLFLLSTRAGGLGVNLTGADTVIIYDSDWNPQCDLQAQDRCHRIGQTKPVVVYRFVTANTIDQKIIERAAAKRKLEKMVIHKGKFKSGNLQARAKPISPQELRDLLQSKDHDKEVKGDNFYISKTEMSALLDRSDLYQKWKKGLTSESSQETSSSEKGSPVSAKKVSTRPSRKTTKKSTKSSKPGTESHQLFKVMEIEEDSSSVTSADNQSVTDEDGSVAASDTKSTGTADDASDLQSVKSEQDS